MSWLWPAMAIEDAVRRGSDLPVYDAVDAVARLVDGEAWLRRARFSSIMYAVLLSRTDVPPEPMRIRRQELEISTTCHPDRLRVDDAAVSWMFLIQVLRDLEKVGEKYGLGSPPLRTGPVPVPAVTPGPPAGNSALSAELAALEDDEILVAVPADLPGEDRAAATARLVRTEESVSRVLGPSRAGSSAGEAYVWAFALPGEAGGGS